MSDLHGRIMNLPLTGEPSGGSSTYRLGHRDARHAAAELASEADARIAEMEAAPAPRPVLRALSEEQLGEIYAETDCECEPDMQWSEIYALKMQRALATKNGYELEEDRG